MAQMYAVLFINKLKLMSVGNHCDGGLTVWQHHGKSCVNRLYTVTVMFRTNTEKDKVRPALEIPA